ncbi:hypothetical protein [Antarcticirhabdus aurantiaca]|uniref:Uncharacterized protein n=1 Tax=Antarcticirhabdus aurantiaca TaxID=2606717 RepID=A0ACD4NJQ9_9HYPH|nr:hypothetical protein [Antarcticirhabdus aurantiaca]WAJ27011.1 hypothetical protein OXU80_19390 [Jeongeuplla avenae]
MTRDRSNTIRGEQQDEKRLLSTEEIVKRPFEPDPDALPTRFRLDDLGRATN